MSSFKTSLHNETTFYPEFINDLNECKSEVIIESPFITTKRMKTLFRLVCVVLPCGNKISNSGLN